MSSFLRRAALLVLLVVATLAAGEIYVRHYPNPARDKHQWMLRHSQEVETLVLGSSHTFYGVRPDMLGSHAFSLAQVSQTYRYDDYLLRHYPMPRLKTVVLPFSYFSLFDDFELMPDEPATAARYRIYMDCDIHPWFSTWHLECAQGAMFKEKLRSLFRPAELSWDSLGFGTNYTLSRRPAEWDDGGVRAAANTHPLDAPSVQANIGFLRSIMDYCRARSVRLILLSTPCLPSFVAHQDARQTAFNDSVLNVLLKEHPEVVRLDWTSDPAFRNAADGHPDFYDSDHLSTRGAAHLSQRLHQHITSLSCPAH